MDDGQAAERRHAEQLLCCIFVTTASAGVAAADLPSLQIAIAPHSNSVAIGTSPRDGWLRRVGDAVLLGVIN